MTQAHTPGPWNLVGTEMIRAENGDTIAHVCEYGRHSLTPNAQRHNAYLITAAPDLLDALKYVENALPKAMGFHRELDVIRAAINKATGV